MDLKAALALFVIILVSVYMANMWSYKMQIEDQKRLDEDFLLRQAQQLAASGA